MAGDPDVQIPQKGYHCDFFAFRMEAAKQDTVRTGHGFIPPVIADQENVDDVTVLSSDSAGFFRGINGRGKKRKYKGRTKKNTQASANTYNSVIHGQEPPNMRICNSLCVSGVQKTKETGHTAFAVCPG
jgi:hypothetical protein